MFERLRLMWTVFPKIRYVNRRRYTRNGAYGSDGHKRFLDICLNYRASREHRKVFVTQGEEENLSHDRRDIPRINFVREHESGSHRASESAA